MSGMSSPTNPWLLARDRYMEDLNDEEKEVFATASLENLLHSASAAQKEHENSRSRALSRRLEPFVAAISQYGKALDLANAFQKYFEKIIDMLTRIGDVLPRCQVYQSLFPTHERLLLAISTTYLDIIHFCADAKATFRKLRKSTTRHRTLKLIWKDFNAEFEGTLSKFRNHVKNVDKEAGVSNMIEDTNERALVRADRAKRERQEKKLDDWRQLNLSMVLWDTSSVIDKLSADTTGKDVTIQSFTSQDIIDKRITRQETAIAFYYCDFSDLKSLETQTILGTVIRELLENIVIPYDLEQKIDQLYRPGMRTAADGELASILCTVAGYFLRVYIFIDGLDECGKDEQAKVLSVVNRLTRARCTSVKIFITSREEAPILTSLREFPRVRVSGDKNSSDIAAFVEDMVKSKVRSGELIQHPSLESEIISALIDGAQGMFLWVHFQLVDLCEAASVSDIRETLRNLPKGMAETYARVLQKIKESHTNMALAQRVFMWIICAKRPLLIAELREAVAFRPTDKSWNAEKIPEASRMIQACRSLIVLGDDETVRLAHHTVQQFLLEPPTKDSIPEFHFQLPQADVGAGEICVAYLSFSDFERQITILGPNNSLPASDIPSPASILDRVATSFGLGYIISGIFKLRKYMHTGNTGQRRLDFDVARFAGIKKPPSPSLREKYVFLDYAIENWIVHTSYFSEDNTTMWKPFEYLAMDRPMPFDIRNWGNSGVPNSLPYTGLFHWAIHAGHVPFLKLLLQLPKGSSLHDYYRQEPDKGQSIILRASSHGHGSVIELLAKEACIDGTDKGLLVKVAECGYDFTVRLLLEYGLCLEAKTEALTRAAETGHTAVMRILLENEPPFALGDRWYRKTLIEAAKKGHDGVLVVLLSKSASFEAAVTDLEVEWGSTVLHADVERGLDEVVRLIAEEWTDINSKTSHGSTALHLAAANGHEIVLRLLIEKGANIAAETGSGETALHYAAANWHEALVRLLTEKGANAAAEISSGWTALHHAAANGHGAIVRLLIENGADVASKTSSGETALHWSAGNGHEAVVRLLTERGADVVAKANSGGTALHWAAGNGHEAVVRLLVKKGADIAAKISSGETALHYAAGNGNETVARLLAEKGADVAAKTSSGDTVLHWAAGYGHMKVARLLAEKGADAAAENISGWTTLHSAAVYGHEAVVRLLVEKGVDVAAKSNSGGTALHYAAANGYEAVVRILVEKVVDMAAEASFGETALHRAAANGREAVVWSKELTLGW
ncbi:MAG: hypothetical protein M1813_008570 [Trichoglossum hirsutum]|nr:MAG: hypothetical protein M1813_008570 [Trichoglossum hirsutum]